MSERKLRLSVARTEELEGCGEEVTLKLRCNRKKKSGDYEFYSLELVMQRYTVHRIARAIATMHVRDRERLALELDRIESEVQAIKQPESK